MSAVLSAIQEDVIEQDTTQQLAADIDLIGTLTDEISEKMKLLDSTKKHVALVANDVKDKQPLTLHGNQYDLVYKACQEKSVLTATAEELFQVGGWDCFTPSTTKSKEVLAKKDYDRLFSVELGVRALQRVVKHS